MIEYLHVISGPYHLLLEAQAILEILELDDTPEDPLETPEAQGSHQRRLWRGTPIQIISFRELLEVSSVEPLEETLGVVYQVDEAFLPAILIVDQVVGLQHLAESDFLSLPPLPNDVLWWFDKTYADPENPNLLYRCRRLLPMKLTIDYHH